MLTFAGERMFLVAGATDMRKSFNGLAGIVREHLQEDPMSRRLFFFCNRARNRMKVLVADESGMWVLAKRPDRGTFAWPAASEDVAKVEYREEQLALLLHGFDASELRPRRWRRRSSRQATIGARKRNLS